MFMVSLWCSAHDYLKRVLFLCVENLVNAANKLLASIS